MFVSLFPDWNARIEFKDSTHATFDGAKCMSKYYLNIQKYNPQTNKKDVTEIFREGLLFEGVDRCATGLLCYLERCLWPDGHEPIPFEKEAEAKKFLKEHKGKKILRFKDIHSKLIRSLDNLNTPS